MVDAIILKDNVKHMLTLIWAEGYPPIFPHNQAKHMNRNYKALYTVVDGDCIVIGAEANRHVRSRPCVAMGLNPDELTNIQIQYLYGKYLMRCRLMPLYWMCEEADGRLFAKRFMLDDAEFGITQ